MTFQSTHDLDRYIETNADYISDHLALPQRRGEIYAEKRILGRDLNVILPHLPQRLGHVLNIGGGPGAFEVLLHQAALVESFTLIDVATRTAKGASFDLKGIAENLWTENGVRQARFLDAQQDKACDRKYDLMVSFRALGFLFPYEWYEELIQTNLLEGGILILDIKKRGAPHDLHSLEDPDVAARFENYRYMHLDLMERLRRTIGGVKVLRDTENSVRVLVRNT